MSVRSTPGASRATTKPHVMRLSGSSALSRYAHFTALFTWASPICHPQPGPGINQVRTTMPQVSICPASQPQPELFAMWITVQWKKGLLRRVDAANESTCVGPAHTTMLSKAPAEDTTLTPKAQQVSTEISLISLPLSMLAPHLRTVGNNAAAAPSRLTCTASHGQSRRTMPITSRRKKKRKKKEVTSPNEC